MPGLLVSPSSLSLRYCTYINPILTDVMYVYIYMYMSALSFSFSILFTVLLFTARCAINMINFSCTSFPIETLGCLSHTTYIIIAHHLHHICVPGVAGSRCATECQERDPEGEVARLRGRPCSPRGRQRPGGQRWRPVTHL